MPTIPYVRATHADGQAWNAAKANVVEAGINDVSYSPAVRVFHNTTQTIATGTATALAFNSERYDQAGNANDTQHDIATNNSRLTCRYAGVYSIVGHAEWTSNPTNADIRIRLNGTTYIGRAGVDGDFRLMTATTQWKLAVNDYVELVVVQSSGGNQTIASTGNSSPEFMMARIG